MAKDIPYDKPLRWFRVFYMRASLRAIFDDEVQAVDEHHARDVLLSKYLFFDRSQISITNVELIKEDEEDGQS